MSDDLASIQARNARVEADKAWETSWTRRLCIAALTYVIVTCYLAFLGVENNLLHAIVPVTGYLLSTLSLDIIKKRWIAKRSVP